MGLFDRFRSEPPRPQAAPDTSADDQAIARYRYMLRTAPPETIEQAHAEAFARLTPEQRRKVLEELRAAAPEGERDPTPVLAEPQALARYATRAEIRQPGTLERTFGAMPAAGGLGLGGMLAGSLLGSMAGTVLGTAIAQHFLDSHAGTELGALDHAQVVDALPVDGPGGDVIDDAGGLDLGDSFDV